MQPYAIREMKICDYVEVHKLWSSIPGMRLEAADSESGISRYLSENRGLSHVAECAGAIVGSVLCGEDGRRGYLQHLCVSESFQNRGIGSALLDTALKAFAAHQLHEVRIFVLRENAEGLAYWEKKGWEYRDNIDVFTYHLATDATEA